MVACAGAADNAGMASTAVYIVDDLPSMRERLREIVTGVGGAHVVGDAGTPALAIAGILSLRPACVLLDYRLEGGTGLDVLRAVAGRAPGTTFVVLTNHPDPQYRRACLAAGAHHFLDKSSEFNCIGDLLRTLQATAH